MAEPTEKEVQELKQVEKLARTRTRTLDEIEEQNDAIRRDLERCLEMLGDIGTMLTGRERGRDSGLQSKIGERMLFAQQFIHDDSLLDTLRKALLYSNDPQSTSQIPEVVLDALKVVLATVDQAFDSYKSSRAAIAYAKAAKLSHSGAELLGSLKGADED